MKQFECGFQNKTSIQLEPNTRTWVPVGCSYKGVKKNFILQPSIDLLLKNLIRIPAGLCDTNINSVIVTNFSDKKQILERNVLIGTGYEAKEIREFKADTCK